MPSSEAIMARDEPESLCLAQKSPIPKARKLGRKLPTPGREKAEATAGGGSCASPAPHASTSPTVRAHCRSLLETAWLTGLALPTCGHKASGAARPSPCPQLLGGQSHHL